MDLLEALVASLGETWPVLTVAEVATALTLAAMTEVFKAPAVLTLDKIPTA